MVKSDVQLEGSIQLNYISTVPDNNESNSELLERENGEFYDDKPQTFEISSTDKTRISLGVLNNGLDTADHLTRRDPYAIENIEVDPIYPEGIYVDELRATAGFGLSSEF